MPRQRTDAERQVADLLHTARQSLGLSMAFLSRFDGTPAPRGRRVPDAAAVPRRHHSGRTPRCARRSWTASCRRDPRPERLPGGDEAPGGQDAPAAQFRARCRSSSATAPFTGRSARPVSRRTRAEPPRPGADGGAGARGGRRPRARRAGHAPSGPRSRSASTPVDRRRRPDVLLQPIVDGATGERVGAEALSRFPAAWGQGAGRRVRRGAPVGRGDELEVLALRRAADHLDRVAGYVSMNVSPATLLTDECRHVSWPAAAATASCSNSPSTTRWTTTTRCSAALAPLRAAGVRLAIDDVGAGFSSLRHIVLTAPDIIKLDRSIVTGVAADPVLRRWCARWWTSPAAAAARSSPRASRRPPTPARWPPAVDLGQGWHFGRATTAAALRDHYPDQPATIEVTARQCPPSGIRTAEAWPCPRPDQAGEPARSLPSSGRPGRPARRAPASRAIVRDVLPDGRRTRVTSSPANSRASRPRWTNSAPRQGLPDREVLRDHRGRRVDPLCTAVRRRAPACIVPTWRRRSFALGITWIAVDGSGYAQASSGKASACCRRAGREWQGAVSNRTGRCLSSCRAGRAPGVVVLRGCRLLRRSSPAAQPQVHQPFRQQSAGHGCRPRNAPINWR